MRIVEKVLNCNTKFRFVIFNEFKELGLSISNGNFLLFVVYGKGVRVVPKKKDATLIIRTNPRYDIHHATHLTRYIVIVKFVLVLVYL